MIQEIFDFGPFEQVCEDERVRESIGIDSADQVRSLGRMHEPKDMFLLWFGTGGFIVLRNGGTRYECHTLFPVGSGVRKVAEWACEAQDWMFINTDCTEIVSYVPDSNKAARALANMSRFEDWFIRPKSWNGEDVTYVKLTLDRWARMCYSSLQRGEKFHLDLENAKGPEGHNHPDDTHHDMYVGSTILMAEAGNWRKAINFYNDWAMCSGYHPIILLKEAPVTVNTGDAILRLSQGNLEILKCL